MREAIVGLKTRFGNMLYFPSGEGKRKEDTDGGKRKQLRKK